MPNEEPVQPTDAAVTVAGGEQHEVEQPAKLLRIAMMVKELLEEARRAPIDEKGRVRLREIYDRVLTELKTGVSGSLAGELERMMVPLGDGAPTESEIRIAQAQLLGWLEGIFQGIQAAIATQQMAAQAQLEEMRRHLLTQGSEPSAQEPSSPGPYL